MLTIERSVVTEICRRSTEGEGVAKILTEMRIDVTEGLLYLQRHHHEEVRTAKKTQIERNREKP